MFAAEKNLEQNADADLVKLMIGGHKAASLVLYNRYVSPLYTYIFYRAKRSRHDTEEISQEVFLDVWKNLKVYDPKKDFWFWMCGIARRKCAKYFRSKEHAMVSIFAKHTVHRQKLVDTLESPNPQPADIIVSREFEDLLALALSALAPNHQILLLLKYKEGKSLQEIARAQVLSVEAVSSGLQRARMRLKEILQWKKGASNE